MIRSRFVGHEEEISEENPPGQLNPANQTARTATDTVAMRSGYSSIACIPASVSSSKSEDSHDPPLRRNPGTGLQSLVRRTRHGYWQAASKHASAITGDITLSDLKITIGFKAFPIASIRDLKPAEVSAVFDADVNTAGFRHALPAESPGGAALSAQEHAVRHAGYAMDGVLCHRQIAAGGVLFRGRSACVYVRRHQSFDKPLRDVYVRALRELAQAAQLPMQVIRW